MQTLKNQDFSGRRVIVRVDFNVPLDSNFQVTDSTRIFAAKETIDFILNRGGCCVLISHLGRPKGEDADLSLSHISAKVEEILGATVSFFGDCIGPAAEEATAAVPRKAAVDDRAQGFEGPRAPVRIHHRFGNPRPI